MPIFTLGILLVLAGIVAAVLRQRLTPDREQAMLLGAGGVIAALIGFGAIVWSTAIYVEDDQTGVVKVKFGEDLQPGKIIATEGQKGPQAEVLPPGWHFFYWPWIYDLESVDTLNIPSGQVGTVRSKDGKPLPEGEVYAPAWPMDDKSKMFEDAQYFLTAGGGYKGQQLTVLSPGQYRYNPRLFEVALQTVLEVEVGEVAVIKAHAGKEYVSPEGEEPMLVNGTPIVPKGHRGIWNEPLTPDAYFLHPQAYSVTRVQTTNRVYEYAGSQAIAVRTKDGFEFPVDVRVSVKISAQDAPYVVAKLANPDKREGEFTVLELRVILPLVRAIFRNTAESRGALEFVSQRSVIEDLATQRLREGLTDYKVETDGVYIADIRIGDTEAGLRLLATQTDREVAQQEQETFAEKKKAQDARAEAVRAEEEANQQIQQAQARSRVIVAQEDAKAMIAKAEGEAEAYRKKMEALGGVDNFIHLEITKMAMDKWEGAVPKVFTFGGEDGGDPTKAVMGLMLDRLQSEQDGQGDKR